MQYKFFFLLCTLQIVQFASAQCGTPAYMPEPAYYPAPIDPLYYPGAPESLYYPGTLPGPIYERGDIEAAGTLGVEGNVYVDGHVPVEGSVQYSGDVTATGTTSVRCSCGNIWI